MNTIEDKIRALLKEHLPERILKSDVGVDENLFEMGMSSMMTITLIVEMENEFGIVFETTDLLGENLCTINKLASYVADRCSAQ
jgi:acyl carrier protein